MLIGQYVKLNGYILGRDKSIAWEGEKRNEKTRDVEYEEP